MNSGLFEYPKQAAFGRTLPKAKIYEHAKPSRSVRDRFVAEVSQIVWQYKLAPETINLPAGVGVPEIQVFVVTLKSEELGEAVLRTIDRAIPFPILFELVHSDQVKTVMAYKRPNEGDSGRWVVDAYFETPWRPVEAPRDPLPVALTLAGLYERMLRVHFELPARSGESLPEQVERIAAIRQKEQQCRQLELRMQRENQFNRKVELNAELRGVRNELTSLRG